jgi:hypothetical protein
MYILQYVHVCVCVCMYVCVCVCVRVRRTCTYTTTQICVRIHILLHKYECVYIYYYTNMCACVDRIYYYTNNAPSRPQTSERDATSRTTENSTSHPHGTSATCHQVRVRSQKSVSGTLNLKIAQRGLFRTCTPSSWQSSWERGFDSLKPLAKERRRCFAFCRGEGVGVGRGSKVEGFRVSGG